MSFGYTRPLADNIPIDNEPESFYYATKKRGTQMSFLVAIKYNNEAWLASDSVNIRLKANGEYDETIKDYPKIFAIPNALIGHLADTTINIGNKYVEVKDYIKDKLPSNLYEMEELVSELQKYVLHCIEFVYFVKEDDGIRFYHFIIKKDRIQKITFTEEVEVLPFGAINIINGFSALEINNIQGKEEKFLNKTINAVAAVEEYTKQHPTVGGNVQMYYLGMNGSLKIQ